MASKGRAFRTLSFEGFEILVGKGDVANDTLTFSIADPLDCWLHVVNFAGSHVVVRNPDQLADLPPAVLGYAAQLAAWYSKARGSRGKAEVHFCQVSDVTKPRGFPPGKVLLRHWQSLRVYPKDPSPSEQDA
jgi:predicted ribosome quality control (RQC) complex YloA/Tae2 family protein